MSMFFEVHTDAGIPVTGYLAIDSLVSGQSHGGLRIASDVTPQRLRLAARTMTLKYGWVGLPVGGAKAGLLMSHDESELDRALSLRAFGRALEPHLRTGRYVPGEDMGSTVDDVRSLLKAAGLKPKPRSLMYAESGRFTGVSVCATALAVAESYDMPAKGLRVTIEGFGNVGSSAAQQFHEAGATVVGVSTSKGALYNENGLDIPTLLSLRRRYGDDAVLRPDAGAPVPSTSLIGLPADVFCPCAEMETITISNAPKLSARVVCPGANVPATEEAEALLNQQEVIVVPDFVANCGGVLGSSMSRAGLGQQEVIAILQRRLKAQTSLLILDAREQRRTLREAATELAVQRSDEARERYERNTPAQLFMRFAVGMYRRGMIPGPLLAPLGRRYYRAGLP